MNGKHKQILLEIIKSPFKQYTYKTIVKHVGIYDSILRKSSFFCDYTVNFLLFDGVISDLLFGTENLLFILLKSVNFWV